MVSIVETSKLLPWIVVICLLSGFGLGLSLWAISDSNRSTDQWAISYSELEREYRLAVLEIDAFNVALAKADIEVDHSGHGHKGDKP